MSETQQTIDKRAYKCSVVTPHGAIFSGDVSSVKAPGHAGEFGVLASHAPIVTVLTKGILILRTPEKELFWVITSGVLEVAPTSHEALILLDNATAAKSLEDAAQILSSPKK